MARVRRVALGLEALRQHAGCDTVVVGEAVTVGVGLVLGGHGELGLQLEHRVEHGGEGCGTGETVLVAQDLSEVLLIQVRPEETGVRVGGLLHGRTYGHAGTSV